MKTIEELYNEVMASDELKKEFLAIKSPEEVETFAKKYGCEATLDEIKAYMTEKQSAVEEMSDDELEQVAGGKGFSLGEALGSIAFVGLACAFIAILSVGNGNCGTAIERDDRMLCDAFVKNK